MSALSAAFTQASNDVQQLPQRPDNLTLLKLYALFKQASTGDADGRRPGLTNPVGRAKYDAWASLQGMTSEEAMQSYVDLVNSLKG